MKIGVIVVIIIIIITGHTEAWTIRGLNVMRKMRLRVQRCTIRTNGNGIRAPEFNRVKSTSLQLMARYRTDDKPLPKLMFTQCPNAYKHQHGFSVLKFSVNGRRMRDKNFLLRCLRTTTERDLRIFNPNGIFYRLYILHEFIFNWE